MFYGWQFVEPEFALRLLLQLEQLFSDPQKWISWPIATNERDEEVKPLDPSATKFSLMGATEKLAHNDYVWPLSGCVDCAVREYLNDLSGDAIIQNKTNYADEMNLIKAAIEELQKEQSK